MRKGLLLFSAVLPAVASWLLPMRCRGGEAPDAVFEGARWVWPVELGSPTNTVVEFRRVFASPKAGKAKLAIAADTVYSIMLNGDSVHTGRFPDVPPMRFYDELPSLTLNEGTNVLEISVYAQGIGTFQHLPGDPGLVYALDADGVRLTSGTDDVWRISNRYRRTGVPLVSPMLGFSFEYDASAREDPWRALSPADAKRCAKDFELRRRPVARVEVGRPLTAKIIGQGTLDGSSVPDCVAQGMDAALLRPCCKSEFFSDGNGSVRPEFFHDGFFITLDLGREESGLLTLGVDTDEGTVIDIGHAEHLEDGRIRTAIGNRNFAGRYRARAGAQSFCHWVHRMAGRYLQIHVRGVRTRFALNELTVRPTMFPVTEAAVPSRLTAAESEIWKTSVRTLRLCQHEHYEDCPWREQALYANDSRNQILAGYFAFSDNGGMPELALELLSRGIDERGWIELCMPAKIGLAIPSFTFSWVLAVGDHLKYRKDPEFIRSMMPALHAILDRRCEELEDGLLPCPVGRRYWQFYDWVKDLSGSEKFEGDAWPHRYESPLNLFAILAFDSGASCADAVGDAVAALRWRKAAGKVRTAVKDRFWNDGKHQVETRLGADLAPAELSQALALLADAVPAAHRAELVKKLSSASEWTKTSLSQSLYKYEALLAAGGAAAVAARREIASVWSGMLDAGATSFWEVREGWKAFGNAGSLCHGWSAIPVYFYGAYPEFFSRVP